MSHCSSLPYFWPMIMAIEWYFTWYLYRSAERLCNCFKKQGGLYVKVGQHISSLDYILPPEYTQAMVPLHDKVSPLPQFWPIYELHNVWVIGSYHKYNHVTYIRRNIGRSRQWKTSSNRSFSFILMTCMLPYILHHGIHACIIEPM